MMCFTVDQVEESENDLRQRSSFDPLILESEDAHFLPFLREDSVINTDQSSATSAAVIISN